MPIVPTDLSSIRRRVFTEALSDLVRLGRVPAGLEVNTEPLPIAALRLADVTREATLSSIAKPIGWRYFAGQQSGPTVVGDITDSSPPMLLALLYGVPAQTAWLAYQKLAGLPVVQTNFYSPVLLRVPEVLTQGFWLKEMGVASGGDQFARYGRAFDEGLGGDKFHPTMSTRDLLLQLLRLSPIEQPPKGMTHPAE